MNNQIILATGGYDHTIKLWKAETKDCIKSMQHTDSVNMKNTSTLCFETEKSIHFSFFVFFFI